MASRNLVAVLIGCTLSVLLGLAGCVTVRLNLDPVQLPESDQQTASFVESIEQFYGQGQIGLRTGRYETMVDGERVRFRVRKDTVVDFHIAAEVTDHLVVRDFSLQSSRPITVRVGPAAATVTELSVSETEGEGPLADIKVRVLETLAANVFGAVAFGGAEQPASLIDWVTASELSVLLRPGSEVRFGSSLFRLDSGGLNVLRFKDVNYLASGPAGGPVLEAALELRLATDAACFSTPGGQEAVSLACVEASELSMVGQYSHEANQSAFTVDGQTPVEISARNALIVAGGAEFDDCRASERWNGLSLAARSSCLAEVAASSDGSVPQSSSLLRGDFRFGQASGTVVWGAESGATFEALLGTIDFDLHGGGRLALASSTIGFGSGSLRASLEWGGGGSTMAVDLYDLGLSDVIFESWRKTAGPVLEFRSPRASATAMVWTPRRPEVAPVEATVVLTAEVSLIRLEDWVFEAGKSGDVRFEADAEGGCDFSGFFSRATLAIPGKGDVSVSFVRVNASFTEVDPLSGRVTLAASASTEVLEGLPVDAEVSDLRFELAGGKLVNSIDVGSIRLSVPLGEVFRRVKKALPKGYRLGVIKGDALRAVPVLTALGNLSTSFFSNMGAWGHRVELSLGRLRSVRATEGAGGSLRIGGRFEVRSRGTYKKTHYRTKTKYCSACVEWNLLNGKCTRKAKTKCGVSVDDYVKKHSFAKVTIPIKYALDVDIAADVPSDIESLVLKPRVSLVEFDIFDDDERGILDWVTRSELRKRLKRVAPVLRVADYLSDDELARLKGVELGALEIGVRGKALQVEAAVAIPAAP